MGFRIHKSIRIAPGLRINLSKRGGSLSLGGRGLSVNLGRRGVRTTVGAPGTGVSWSKETGYGGLAEGIARGGRGWLMPLVLVVLAIAAVALAVAMAAS